jgi:PAS domain S-box-containing protein
MLGGYAEEEMTGKAVLSFIHPSDQSRIHKRVEDRLGGAVFLDTAQFRVYAKDGSIRHLESRAVVIDWDGGPATVCFLSEIPDPAPDSMADSIPVAR